MRKHGSDKGPIDSLPWWGLVLMVILFVVLVGYLRHQHPYAFPF